jgi:hypothetical protein
MVDDSGDGCKRRWFLWGVVLTWIVCIPAIVGAFNAFRGISDQKATGLGAVAGGLAEIYVMFGLLLALVMPVGAIVLLARSVSRGHRIRTMLSLLHICGSAFTLILAGLAVWMLFIYLPHAPAGPR